MAPESTVMATLAPTEAPAGTPSLPPPMIDLTDDSDHIEAAIYPTIGELLGELDEATPGLSFARYEEELLGAGFGHVHEVVDTPNVQHIFDRLAIPVGIREEIFERAARIVRRAEKVKQVTKIEEPPV